MTVDLMKQAFEDIKARGQRGMTIYYTLRELSNIAPELFAFRSLGDEIIKSTGAFVYSTDGLAVWRARAAATRGCASTWCPATRRAGSRRCPAARSTRRSRPTGTGDW